jgi:phosphoenolpyruvate carboxylase
MRMDIRQESARHTAAVDAVARHVGAGPYAEWTEEQRVAWLSEELASRRPLIPRAVDLDPDTGEVIATCRVASALGDASLSAYVISMARTPSDVLAVELLLREAARSADPPLPPAPLRVVPLFETLDDLERAGRVMAALFDVPWYRARLRDVHDEHQEVMLGYSDSGKDAGRLAAAWALYRAQEEIVAVCEAAGVKLTLFHGRGGTVGRGGGPMYLAIQSQPPGSVRGSLRITEQGEMVNAKFSVPAVARRQLEVYTTAVLMATVSPPRPPRDPRWRAVMDALAASSCAAYRAVVFQDPAFVPYFRAATPEAELGALNIGSRPARRPAGDAGVAGLRAIPWQFAWTQNRSVLPAWLGIGTAIADLTAQDPTALATLRAMYKDWPFFTSTIDLAEMVMSKGAFCCSRRRKGGGGERGHRAAPREGGAPASLFFTHPSPSLLPPSRTHPPTHPPP